MAGAIQKAQSRQTRQSVSIGDIQSVAITGNGDYALELSVVAEKVSFQATGSVAGTIAFSLDGENFKNPTALVASNGIGTYTTSLAKVVKITVSGGTGRVVVAAK